ncbi:MAG: tyrosine-type recombinase/integrase [Anaerolineae bacterium]|nr:tyrosine-type recombinase/integrase [Anaerolineae bacterium]
MARVSQALREQGYSEFSATRSFLPLILGRVLLEQRSPYLEDISVTRLQRLYGTIENANHRVAVRRLAYALFVLEVIPEPISPPKDDTYSSISGMTDGIHPDWVALSRRWMETSTYRPETRKAYYRKLLQVGRWLAATHPEVASPADWTRDLAVEYIAMIDDMRVGDWTYGYRSDKVGNPLRPNTKADFIAVMRIFCRDCQEWGWVRLQLDPGRSFSVPGAILSKIGPAPRTIADEMWAKIMWAGLNLQPDDLLFGRDRAFEGAAYPVEMVRALAITWLFSGLRVNEIRRLRLGCIRWQAEAETGQDVCLLTVPINKTSGEYVKPVDPLVGRAIDAWHRVRPVSPPMWDRRTGEEVQFLFAYRAVPVGRQFLNKVLIPLLCHKAGVPVTDTRGRITSHRARATIASQLYNAREGMSLSELQAWLGHRVPESTQHYVAVSAAKQAEAYADAGYLANNKRLVEVLIDQDAVRQGRAQAGEPWRYYDVGHGHCTYDFFDQCPHRLACVRCRFYLPKASSQNQFLEARRNLQRMLQELQLTEAEQEAVEDGVVVIDKLLARLVDVPTPAGQTPREIATGAGQPGDTRENQP